jgi:hypothetical protein
MERLSKPGVVLIGYAAALLVSCIVFYAYVYVSNWTNAVQASGGMQAFGDFLLLVGLFGFLALFPTALALYYLRPFEKFWRVFSIASLVLAISGLLAALMIGRLQRPPGAILGVGFFGLVEILGAPLLGLCFSTCAVIAPTRSSRRFLFAAAGIEFVVSAYVFVCLVVLGHWLL